MPGDASNYQLRACLADPEGFKTKVLTFYEKTWESYKPELLSDKLPALALWDLFCTATIVGAPDAARTVAKVSYVDSSI